MKQNRSTSIQQIWPYWCVPAEYHHTERHRNTWDRTAPVLLAPKQRWHEVLPSRSVFLLPARSPSRCCINQCSGWSQGLVWSPLPQRTEKGGLLKKNCNSAYKSQLSEWFTFPRGLLVPMCPPRLSNPRMAQQPQDSPQTAWPPSLKPCQLCRLRASSAPSVSPTSAPCTSITVFHSSTQHIWNQLRELISISLDMVLILLELQGKSSGEGRQ
jgi:hypothetical protein